MKNIIYCIAILSSLTLNGVAQKYTYRSVIGQVEESNYYNIELNQEMIGVSSRKDFSDLRIVNSKGDEIPYFLRSENPVQEISRFVAYPLLENITKDSINTIIIENDENAIISRFYIILRKAEVNKSIRIRGSHDNKKWYIVKQNEDITYAGFIREENEVIVVDFPGGNYRYYELTLMNNQNSPLDVLNVVKIENSNLFAQLNRIDSGRFVQNDSTDKKTYLFFPEMYQAYRVSKMEFFVAGKAYYKRSGSILPENERFTISSDFSNSIYLNSLLVNKETRICIDNKDNLPLSIDSVRMYAMSRYVCAFLEAGDKYTLTIEKDSKENRPQYDIEHFRNKIPDDLPVLQTAPMEITSVRDLSGERQVMWIEKPVVLWSIIIGIGLFLIVICLLLMKDMKK